MPYYRNWSAICALVDSHLKFCVSLATDERALEGLQRGFPELFTEEPGINGPWPWSALDHLFVCESHGIIYWEENSELGFDRVLGFLECHHVPIVKATDDPEAPDEWTQLSLEEVGALLESNDAHGYFWGFPARNNVVVIFGKKYYFVMVDGGWENEGGFTRAILFPCELVDLNA